MIHRDLTREQYDALPGVSNSTLKRFVDCPESFSRGIVPPRTDAMQFGCDVEDWLRFGELPDVVVIPPNKLTSNGQRRGSAWEQFAADNVGKRLLKPGEAEQLGMILGAIRCQVMAHRIARICLERGEWQVGYTWHGCGDVKCKGLVDLVGDHIGDAFIADVKTTEDIGGFDRQIARFRYHWQAWTYREAHYATTGVLPEFFFVAISSKPPYRVEVFELASEWYDLAEREVTAARQLWQEYQDKPKPWRSPTHGQVRLVECPGYLRRVNA